MTKEEILEAMRNRHACKLFDDRRSIGDEERETLLEVIRLSPSSFGMEPWRVIVVRDGELKARLRPACWNQQQITTCSDLVVFTVDVAAVAPGTEYVRRLFARRGLAAEALEGYLARYAAFHDEFAAGFGAEQGRFQWAARQCYIAAGNLMTLAAGLGIDSCPIEGFSKGEAERILGLDGRDRQLVLMVALGYRVNPVTAKYRLAREEMIEVR